MAMKRFFLKDRRGCNGVLTSQPSLTSLFVLLWLKLKSLAALAAETIIAAECSRCGSLRFSPGAAC